VRARINRSQPSRYPAKGYALIEHGLLLPILLYYIDPLGRPMLGPPRQGAKTEAFLRSTHHDIPLVVHEIREFWMPQRVREVNHQS
jgi:uncharacterized protein